METASTRSGSTLVEVLVSLLITAIGIVGVASIFPVSVLRAVQATRLNKSVLLRNNVEELIDLDSRIVHDPDGDGDFAEHNETNFVVDPLGHMIMATTKNTNEAGSLGGLPRMGLGAILDPSTQKALDPLGPFPTPITVIQNINRLTFKAAELVTLPDTWVTQSEAIVNITTAATTIPATIDVIGTDIDGDGDGDLSEISFSDPLVTKNINKMPSRVIVSTPDGKQSVSRIVSSIAGTTLTLANPLPAGFVGRFRVIVETKEFRYSWMLSVRKSAGNGTFPLPMTDPQPQFGDTIDDPHYSDNGSFQVNAELGLASVEVVIFLNRRFSRDDELIYVITPLNDGLGDQKGRWYRVDFGTNPRPAIKRGGFMLDPANARWYRIEKIKDETATDTLILLDRTQPAGDVLATGPITKGIFMKGVIEVFPIGNK